MSKAQPIDELLAQPDLPDNLREKLLLVKATRTFADEVMQLPVGGAYQDYTDLQRNAVVWNVVAAPEFSLENKTWCFPVAGCTTYKGYFLKTAAEAEAASLAQEGYDVSLAGVTAYSTLGWFDDPVLNTFLDAGDRQLAELLLHELAHRRLYIKSDTVLNESWATAVARAGLQQLAGSAAAANWTLSVQTRSAENLPADSTQIERLFFEMTEQTLRDLEKLYQHKKDAPLQHTMVQWREKKQAILQRFQAGFAERTKGMAAADGYRHWLENTASPLNNARLLSVHNYQKWVPALTYQLQVIMHGQWEDFYRWSDVLAAQDEALRRQTLQNLDLMANPE